MHSPRDFGLDVQTTSKLSLGPRPCIHRTLRGDTPGVFRMFIHTLIMLPLIALGIKVPLEAPLPESLTGFFTIVPAVK